MIYGEILYERLMMLSMFVSSFGWTALVTLRGNVKFVNPALVLLLTAASVFPVEFSKQKDIILVIVRPGLAVLVLIIIKHMLHRSFDSEKTAEWVGFIGALPSADVLLH